MSEQAENQNVVSIVQPSDAAKVQRRQVYEKLEDLYDEKHKRYKVGLNGFHTDAGIAKQIGCSEALVQKVREEFFGPATIDEPTEEIKQMQIDLAHLRKEADNWEAHAKGLAKQAVDIRKLATDLSQRIKAMCEAHGWYH